MTARELAHGKFGWEIFLTLNSAEMPSNAYKAVGHSCAGVDTYLWEWQSMLLLLPPSSLNLERSTVPDGTWVEEFRSHKPG